jgi:hypothetical protein
MPCDNFILGQNFLGLNETEARASDTRVAGRLQSLDRLNEAATLTPHLLEEFYEDRNYEPTTILLDGVRLDLLIGVPPATPEPAKLKVPPKTPAS